MEELNLFKFDFEGIEFWAEMPKNRKFGLFRIFDLVYDFFQIRPNEFFFEYYKKQILSINTAESFGDSILIKRISQHEISFKVCKLVLKNFEGIESVWAVTSKTHPTVSNFLSSLSEDDEFREVFKQEFQVFFEENELSFDQPIPGFEDFCQLELRQKPLEDNPVKFEVKSFGYPTINVSFNPSCNFQVFMNNIALFYGFIPDVCKFFKGPSLIENKNDILFNYQLNGTVLDLVYNVGGASDNHFKNIIEFNPEAPDSRRVVRGLNFKCICVNDYSNVKCELFRKVFMSNEGYGNFNLNHCKTTIKCPVCKYPCEIRSFGIYKARLEVIRFYKTGDLVKYDLFENYEDHYMSLDCYLSKFKEAADIEFQVTYPHQSK
jgi:hypothetical protein